MSIYKNGPDFPYINPNYTCYRCGAEHNDDYAFCPSCGKISSVFTVQETVTDNCINHPKYPATMYCSLCSEPICEECNGKESFSFTAGDKCYCKNCMKKSAQLEAEYLAKHNCIGHPDRPAVDFCLWCSKPICMECKSEEKTYRDEFSGGYEKHKSRLCPSCVETAKERHEKKYAERMSQKKGFLGFLGKILGSD